MKIKPEHYEHMKSIIEQWAVTDVVKQHRLHLQTRPEVKDVEKRLRWDCYYHSGLAGWVCSNVYPYANDDHIDTALRNILKELGI